MTFPRSADSEHDARERFMATPDAPRAGQRSDVASTRAAAVPPESRSLSRTGGAARVAPATHTCRSTKAGLDQPRPTVALLANCTTGCWRATRPTPRNACGARPAGLAGVRQGMGREGCRGRLSRLGETPHLPGVSSFGRRGRTGDLTDGAGARCHNRRNLALCRAFRLHPDSSRATSRAIETPKALGTRARKTPHLRGFYRGARI
jgi:hypothetical protein